MDIIPKLNSLDPEDLEDLLANDDKVDEFIEKLPDVASILQRSNQLCEENLELANTNLEYQTTYEKLRESTISKLEELEVLRSHFDKLDQEQQELSKKLSPANIQNSIKLAAAQDEQIGEEIAEQFLKDSLTVGTFLDKFLDQKMKFYAKNFKADRLGRQLNELKKAGF